MHFFEARNLCRTIFRSRAPERNELFLPKRMAYVVELDDEFADTDIPTTLIRSKADCPTLEVSAQVYSPEMLVNIISHGHFAAVPCCEWALCMC